MPARSDFLTSGRLVFPTYGGETQKEAILLTPIDLVNKCIDSDCVKVYQLVVAGVRGDECRSEY